MLIKRRSLLLGASAGFALGGLATRPALASNTNHVRVGAIRWDAWYSPTPGSSSSYAIANLGPAQYQARAPWFASKASNYSMVIDGGNQATMDAEIAYAVGGGLKYWAFCWYAPTSPFRSAWNFYQSSTHKSQINWCVLTSFSGLTTLFGTNELVGYFQQSSYETVLSGRPLLYLLSDSTSNATISAAIASLRTACTSAGVGNPYVVIMALTPTPVTIGADATSAYNYSPYPPSSFGTYASLDALVRTYWTTLAAIGPIIPIGVTGFDRRPRIEHPVPWEPSQIPYSQMSSAVQTALPSELATHLQAMLTWMGSNAVSVPANNALVYAWNEFDEGGWLCPTWTVSGADHSRLDAIAPIIS